MTLDGSEKLRILHADLNAAQNLAVWALEGYAEPVRVVAKRISEEPRVYAAAKLGKRLAGALGGQAIVLKPVDSSTWSLDLIAYPTWKEAASHLGLAVAQRPPAVDSDSETQDTTDVLLAELAELEAELTGETASTCFATLRTLCSVGGGWRVATTGHSSSGKWCGRLRARATPRVVGALRARPGVHLACRVQRGTSPRGSPLRPQRDAHPTGQRICARFQALRFFE